jgi:type IV pilus secretin PilQ/predicted competence protein
MLVFGAVETLAAEPADGGPEKVAKLPLQERMQTEICINFREMPIEDVLMMMAKQADIDIIKSPKVEGMVTASMTDVPLEEALTNILETHGYAYVMTQNMIRVIPREDVVDAREKIISRVYRVTYADVTQVEAALKKFISDQGAISSNPGTSNIIVTDVESKVLAMDEFVAEIDQITPQILVEAKIYDINSKDRMDLGVEWQMGTQTGFGTPVVVNGTPVGVVGNADSSTVTNPHLTSRFLGATNKTSDTSGLFRFGISNDHVRLDAILKAQQEDVRAKLLANPRIMVLDNELAEIKIVEEIPYQELTESSAGGSIGTTQFRDVGVELRVTPHVTREGLIRLLLNPKFSMRTGDVSAGAGGTPQPIIATRETTTTALIRDGQTVVIGGMKKQDASQQINKIPLLGDLPLLGGLFRFEGESTVNSELVVFITPYIVHNPVLTEEEQRHLSNTVFVTPNVPEPKLKKQ